LLAFKDLRFMANLVHWMMKMISAPEYWLSVNFNTATEE
jgi:hypothetical protein